ncbi:MAG: hypothetical protein QF416_06600, partial [Candidatus Marinimicrobia bacterium]|nr:hypothetical protein [Candidatus Neomarinimicrobiota bacterium]
MGDEEEQPAGGSMLPPAVNPTQEAEEDTAFEKAKKMFGFYKIQFQSDYDTFNKAYDRCKESITRQGTAPLNPAMTKVLSKLLATLEKNRQSCDTTAELLRTYCMEARDKDPHAGKNVARWTEHVNNRQTMVVKIEDRILEVSLLFAGMGICLPDQDDGRARGHIPIRGDAAGGGGHVNTKIDKHRLPRHTLTMDSDPVSLFRWLNTFRGLAASKLWDWDLLYTYVKGAMGDMMLDTLLQRFPTPPGSFEEVAVFLIENNRIRNPLVVTRKNLFTRHQESGESFSEYAAAMEGMKCTADLQMMGPNEIFSQLLIIGCRSDKIREELLKMDSMDPNVLINRGKQLEAIQAVNTTTRQQQNSEVFAVADTECWRCLGLGHFSRQCKASADVIRKLHCNRCKGYGHSHWLCPKFNSRENSRSRGSRRESFSRNKSWSRGGSRSRGSSAPPSRGESRPPTPGWDRSKSMSRRTNHGSSIQQLEVTLKQAQDSMREVAQKLSVLAVGESHVSMVGGSHSSDHSSPELPHPLTDSANTSGSDSEQEDIGVFAVVVEENEVMLSRSKSGRRRNVATFQVSRSAKRGSDWLDQECLADTGADDNVCSPLFVNTLKLKIWPVKEHKRFTDAQGHDLGLLGWVRFFVERKNG